MQKSLLEHLATIEDVLSRLPKGYSLEESKRIADMVRDIDTTPLRICIIGPFSSGKTSILNSLIGRPVLPTSLKETTFTSFLVSTVGEGQDEHLEVPEKGRLALEAVTEVNLSEHQEVKVFVRSEAIPSGFQFLDTPGLSSAFEVHERITAKALDLADVLLFVVDAKQGVPRAMLDFIQAHPAFAAKSYLVLNKADLVPEPERGKVLKFNRNVVRPLKVAEVLLTSTVDMPGIDALRTLIVQDLPPKAKVLKTKTGARRLLALCSSLQMLLQELIEATTLDTSSIDARIQAHIVKREQILRDIDRKTEDLANQVKSSCRSTVTSFERRAMALVNTWTHRILDGAAETGFVEDLRAIWEEEATNLRREIQRLIGNYRADLEGIAGDAYVAMPWWTNWIDWVFAALAAILGPLTGGWGNLLEAVVGKLFGKEISKKIAGRVVQNALQAVVSEWIREVNQQMNNRIADLREDVKRYVVNTLEPQMKEVEIALEQLRNEKASLVLDVETRKKSLLADLQTVGAVMKDLQKEVVG